MTLITKIGNHLEIVILDGAMKIQLSLTIKGIFIRNHLSHQSHVARVDGQIDSIQFGQLGTRHEHQHIKAVDEDPQNLDTLFAQSGENEPRQWNRHALEFATERKYYISS